MRIAGNLRGLDIDARCDWALEQERIHGARLCENAEVTRLLAELGDFIAASRESMTAADLVEACRICEEEEGGSCCGCGMEDHYDGVLMLINLMLEAEIEEEWRDEESCLFLGPTGCRLPARDHVCVNYLCMKLGDRVAPPAVAEMRKSQGRELDTLFRLTDHITNLLRKLHADPGGSPRS